MNPSTVPSYKEIQGQFELQQRFGQGSYGEVFKAQHKKTGKVVAIKKVFKGAQNIVKHMPEIRAMKSCNSPYILAYYGCEWLREDLLVRPTLIFSPPKPKIAPAHRPLARLLPGPSNAAALTTALLTQTSPHSYTPFFATGPSPFFFCALPTSLEASLFFRENVSQISLFGANFAIWRAVQLQEQECWNALPFREEWVRGVHW